MSSYICSCSNSFVICFLEEAIFWEQQETCCWGMYSTPTFITFMWLQETAMSQGLVVWFLVCLFFCFFYIGLVFNHWNDTQRRLIVSTCDGSQECPYSCSLVYMYWVGAAKIVGFNYTGGGLLTLADLLVVSPYLCGTAQQDSINSW